MKTENQMSFCVLKGIDMKHCAKTGSELAYYVLNINLYPLEIFDY